MTGGYTVGINDVASYNDPDTGTTVTADGVDGLFTFTSTDPSQIGYGDKEWVALAIQTDEDALNLTWDGVAITQNDVNEAIANGYTDGKTIIFWAKYDALAGAGRTATIGTVDGSKTAKTITFTQA